MSQGSPRSPGSQSSGSGSSGRGGSRPGPGRGRGRGRGSRGGARAPSPGTPPGSPGSLLPPAIVPAVAPAVAPSLGPLPPLAPAGGGGGWGRGLFGFGGASAIQVPFAQVPVAQVPVVPVPVVPGMSGANVLREMAARPAPTIGTLHRVQPKQGPFSNIPDGILRAGMGNLVALSANAPRAVRGSSLAATGAAISAGGGSSSSARVAGAIAGADSPREVHRRAPVHIGLAEPTITIDAPHVITEFNMLIETYINDTIKPVIAGLLSAGIVRKETLDEIFEVLSETIQGPLENFVEQLGARSPQVRIKIDMRNYEDFLTRLGTMTRDEVTQQAIAECRQKIAEAIPNQLTAAQEPGFWERTWAYVRRRPPPRGSLSFSQVFPSYAPPGYRVRTAIPVAGGAAAGGQGLGPAAPPAVAAQGPPTEEYYAFVPSNEEVEKRRRILIERAQKDYEQASRYIQRFRQPTGRMAASNSTIKQLYEGIFGIFTQYMDILVKTIHHRLSRATPLSRAESTAASQQAYVEAMGDREVEINLNALAGWEFISRDQIESLLQQMILTMVTYTNISPVFADIVPLLTKIYSVSVLYLSIADIDTSLGERRILTANFSELLEDIVIEIGTKAHVMQRKYIVRGSHWFNGGTLTQNLGRLKTTLLSFVSLVSPEKRERVSVRMEEGRIAAIERTGPKTTIELTRELGEIIGNIASPVLCGMDRLMELLTPEQFTQTTELIREARIERRRPRGAGFVRELAELGIDVTMGSYELARVAMIRANRATTQFVANAGALQIVEHIVEETVKLNDEDMATLMEMVEQDQGSYQQIRTALQSTYAFNYVPGSEVEAEGAEYRHAGLNELMCIPLSALEPMKESARASLAATLHILNPRASRTRMGDFENWEVEVHDWSVFADYDQFILQFQDYAQRTSEDPIYKEFHKYIHSEVIYQHLPYFTEEQLSELYGFLDYATDEPDWQDQFGRLFYLVSTEIERKQREKMETRLARIEEAEDALTRAEAGAEANTTQEASVARVAVARGASMAQRIRSMAGSVSNMARTAVRAFSGMRRTPAPQVNAPKSRSSSKSSKSARSARSSRNSGSLGNRSGSVGSNLESLGSVRSSLSSGSARSRRSGSSRSGSSLNSRSRSGRRRKKDNTFKNRNVNAKRQRTRRNSNSNGGSNGGRGMAQNRTRRSKSNSNSGSNYGVRGSRTRAKRMSNRELEQNIQLALAGEAVPYGNTPENLARLHFESGDGIADIENCTSIELLVDIVNIPETTDLRRRMIIAARARMQELGTPRS